MLILGRLDHITLAKIRPGLLPDADATPDGIPMDPDLGAVPQVLEAQVLLLHHPGEVAARVVDPNVRVAGLVVVVQQAPHASPAARRQRPARPPGHVGLVDALALEPLRRPGLEGVDLLEDRADPDLELDGAVAEVPYPGAESGGLSVVFAPIKAAS